MNRSQDSKAAAFVAVMAVALGGVPNAAHAALTTYTTEASWLSAVAPPTLINFDNLADATPVTNQYAGVTFSAVNGGNPLAVNYGSSFSGINALSLGTPPLTGGGGGVAANFSAPQDGVGFWYLDSQFKGNNVKVFDGLGNELGAYELAYPHPGEWLFVGFTSSTNDIARIELAIGMEDAVAMDSFLFSASVSAVPEPSTAALAWVGGLFVAAALRRRTRTR